MTAAEYEAMVSRRLEDLKPFAVREFREIISASLERVASIVDIEISADSLFDGFPVRVYFMAPDGGSEVAPSHGLLENHPRAKWSPPEREAVLLASEEGLDVYGVDLPLFLEWLSLCWAEATADSPGPRAFLGEHDGIESLDLRERTWIQSDAKWQYSGEPPN